MLQLYMYSQMVGYERDERVENVFSPPEGDCLPVCKQRLTCLLKNSVFLVTFLSDPTHPCPIGRN